MSRSRVGIAAIVVAVLISGCSVGFDGPMRGMHRTMWGGGSASAPPAPGPLPDAEELLVVATEFAFDPAEFTLEVGRPVNILLRNDGTIEHDLTIEGIGFQLIVAPGSEATGALTIDRPGSFRFVCTIPGHADAGMVGTIVVR